MIGLDLPVTADAGSITYHHADVLYRPNGSNESADAELGTEGTSELDVSPVGILVTSGSVSPGCGNRQKQACVLEHPKQQLSPPESL